MRIAIASLLAVWAVFVVAVLRLDILLADWPYNRRRRRELDERDAALEGASDA